MAYLDFLSLCIRAPYVIIWHVNDPEYPKAVAAERAKNGGSIIGMATAASVMAGTSTCLDAGRLSLRR